MGAHCYAEVLGSIPSSSFFFRDNFLAIIGGDRI